MKSFGDYFALHPPDYGLSGAGPSAKAIVGFIGQIESNSDLVLGGCGSVFRDNVRYASIGFHAANNTVRRWYALFHGDPMLIRLEVALFGRPAYVMTEGLWETTFPRAWKLVQESEGLPQQTAAAAAAAVCPGGSDILGHLPELTHE